MSATPTPDAQSSQPASRDLDKAIADKIFGTDPSFDPPEYSTDYAAAVQVARLFRMTIEFGDEDNPLSGDVSATVSKGREELTQIRQTFTGAVYAVALLAEEAGWWHK